MRRQETNPAEEGACTFGSGPVRMGQGVEFDYCCSSLVHGTFAKEGSGDSDQYVNDNPETRVSTEL